MPSLYRDGQDTTLAVETPEGITFVLHPAGPAVRACAFAMDTLVQWALVFAANMVLGTMAVYTGMWLLLLMVFGINWFYHVFCELTFKGQSLGKRIMGLRVVMSGGSPVSPGASFLRNLLRFADTFLYLPLIALLSMTASSGFRRLGDWAGDTVVVYTASSLSPARRPDMSWLSRFEYVQPVRPLSFEEKQGVLMFARRYPLLGRERAEELARNFAPVLKGEAYASMADAEFLLGLARGIAGEGP